MFKQNQKATNFLVQFLFFTAKFFFIINYLHSPKFIFSTINIFTSNSHSFQISLDNYNNKYTPNPNKQIQKFHNPFQKNKKMSQLLDFICGYISGLSQIIIGQPLDFIKTQYQLSTKIATNIPKLQLIKSIINNYNIIKLYQGSSCLFLCYPFIIATQFTIYQKYKKYWMNQHHHIRGKVAQEVLSIKQIIITGSIVGFFVSFLYCPIQYAKIQRQVQVNGNNGSLKILLNQLHNNKFSNIYKGLLATTFRQIIGTGCYFSSYEYSVRVLSKFNQTPRRFAKYSYYLISGSIAGFIYWMVIYPIDGIKTRIQSGLTFKQSFINFRKRAYNGLFVCVIRGAIVNGISFATFQQCKRNTQMLSYLAVC